VQRAARHDLLLTGRQALAEAEWEKARECFERALDLGEGPDAMEGLAQALQWLGQYDAAIAMREAAFPAYRREGLALEACDQARALAFLHGAVHGNEAAASGWFARAQSVLEGVEEAPQHGWLSFDRAPLTRDPAERERLARDALTIARRFGDADLEFGALALLGESYVYTGRAVEGMALIDEAMAAVSSGEVSGVGAVGDIYCRLLSACERIADVRRAEQWMSVVDRFVQRSGDLLVSTTCRMHYGGILAEVGRWPEAEEHLLSAVRLSERSYLAMRPYPLVRLAELRVRQGRFEEAQRLLEGTDWHPRARACMAAIALARGDAGLAKDLVELCLGSEDRSDPACAPILDLLVDVELARGQRAAANDALDLLHQLADRSGNDRARAYAAFAAGRVRSAEADARAVADLQVALEAFADLDLPFDAARARLHLAGAIAADAPDGAMAEARVALREFERLGADRDADTTAALLRELGASGRAWPRAYGTLTKRETEVLALLADGLSNADIADRLVISRRTAEHHVASILSKLGLRSRAEAAVYAVREPPEGHVAE
jgi:DNA-binding CsgD family transcriptional regulator/tetratricopeptide (TPR) repeat protein